MPADDIQVWCYSGCRANERPVAVSIRGRRYEVAEVLDRWYGVGYSYFKVRLEDGAAWLLRFDEWDDRWEARPAGEFPGPRPEWPERHNDPKGGR